jgi:hypothetical protein
MKYLEKNNQENKVFAAFALVVVIFTMLICLSSCSKDEDVIEPVTVNTFISVDSLKGVWEFQSIKYEGITYTVDSNIVNPDISTKCKNMYFETDIIMYESNVYYPDIYWSYMYHYSVFDIETNTVIQLSESKIYKVISYNEDILILEGIKMFNNVPIYTLVLKKRYINPVETSNLTLDSLIGVWNFESFEYKNNIDTALYQLEKTDLISMVINPNNRLFLVYHSGYIIKDLIINITDKNVIRFDNNNDIILNVTSFKNKKIAFDLYQNDILAGLYTFKKQKI